tara:strand:+ start:969 stop:1193 length:225 start_codon:yes stop_codon:yes gene_type:complete
MSEEAVTIEIEGVSHDLASLPVETQNSVQRIAVLRQRKMALEQELAELNLVIDAYGKSVIESVKPVEDDAAVNE